MAISLNLRANAARLGNELSRVFEIAAPTAAIGSALSRVIQNIEQLTNPIAIRTNCLITGLTAYGSANILRSCMDQRASSFSRAWMFLKGALPLGGAIALYNGLGASYLEHFFKAQDAGTTLSAAIATLGASLAYSAGTLSLDLKKVWTVGGSNPDEILGRIFSSFSIMLITGPPLGYLGALGIASQEALLLQRTTRELGEDNPPLVERCITFAQAGLLISAAGAVAACTRAFGIAGTVASSALLGYLIKI